MIKSIFCLSLLVCGHLDAMVQQENNSLRVSPKREQEPINYSVLNSHLISAIKQGNAPLMKEFLHKGARLSDKDHRGLTPFFWAAIVGFKEGMNILLDHFEKQGTTGQEEIDDLLRAAVRQRAQLIFLCSRDDKNISWNFLDAQGKRIEKLKAFTAACQEDGLHDIDRIKNIFECIGEQVAYNTALHHAVSGGLTSLVAELIAAGADTDSQNSYGVSPVALAVAKRYENILTMLIAAKANIEAPEVVNYRRPLHAACSNSDFESVRLLLEAGAQCAHFDGPLLQITQPFDMLDDVGKQKYKDLLVQVSIVRYGPTEKAFVRAVHRIWPVVYMLGILCGLPPYIILEILSLSHFEELKTMLLYELRGPKKTIKSILADYCLIETDKGDVVISRRALVSEKYAHFFAPLLLNTKEEVYNDLKTKLGADCDKLQIDKEAFQAEICRDLKLLIANKIRELIDKRFAGASV